MALPEIGKWLAKLDGPVVIVDKSEEDQSKVGVQAFLPCIVIQDGPELNKTITAIVTLVDKTGAVMVNTWTKFRKIFGNHPTPVEMFAADQSEAQFEIDVQDEEYQGRVSRKVKWVNVPGEGGGMNIPAASNPKSILAKYGSQFRALAGGSPAKSKTTPPPPAAKTPPPVPQTGPTATMTEAWNALLEKNPKATSEDCTQFWQDKIAQLYPGKTNSDLTPHDWGKLKELFSSTSDND